MNYTINYAASGSSGQSLLPQQIPVGGSGQRTLVLTPPVSQSSGNQVLMQVGGSNNPVFYHAYPSTEGIVSPSIANNCNEAKAPVNSHMGQVVLSPVSAVQNSSSPTLQAVSITGDNKASVARPLAEKFNMHTINSGPLVNTTNVGANAPVTQSADFAGILSSLNSAGFQIVDSGNAPVNVHSSDLSSDSKVVLTYFTTLPSAVPLVDSNAEKSISISVPTGGSFDEKQIACENNIIPVCNGPVNMEKIYRIIDTSGNEKVFTSGFQDVGSKEVADQITHNAR